MADVIRPLTFHEHLDQCRQCRENPFALCAYGAKALRTAALDELNKSPLLRRQSSPTTGRTE